MDSEQGSWEGRGNCGHLDRLWTRGTGELWYDQGPGTDRATVLEDSSGSMSIPFMDKELLWVGRSWRQGDPGGLGTHEGNGQGRLGAATRNGRKEWWHKILRDWAMKRSCQ